jgi:hypothetical protein
MPSNAFEDMDEFFDFSALDQYHGLDESHGFQQQHAATNSANNITAMDWAMDWTADSATVRPTDIVLPQKMQAHESSNAISAVEHPQQWLQADENVVQFMSRTDDSVNLTTSFTWPTNSSTPANELMISGFYASTLPSSSSFAPLGRAVDDDKGLTDILGAAPGSISLEHDQPAVQSDVLSLLQTPQPSSQSTSFPSLRQAPIANRKPASAKRKGPQSRIPLEAKQILEDEFAANPYPCSWEMDIIAHQANLDVKKVRNWFNNTRARKKGEGELPFTICSYCTHIIRPFAYHTGGARSEHSFAEIKAVKR